MALRFLLDEHLRGPLWNAIQRHNLGSGLPIDAVRVGDAPDLPLGSMDPDILIWAEREQRLILTEDRNSMPRYLADHLNAGRHSPGVIIIALGSSLAPAIQHLELLAHAGVPDDFTDQVVFVP